MDNSTLLNLAGTFGTPLYVYDGDKIEEKINALRGAFPDIRIKIKYACKANTNISVLSLMRSLGVEVDVVSPQEMHLAFKAGFSPDQITFTSSGVGFEEIEECLAEGVLVNVDNLSALEKFGQKYGNTRPLFIRIRPNVQGGGNLKISTGHGNSKFGIPVEQKAEILRLVNQYNLNIVGLHQHTGSDIKDGETFLQAAEVMFELAMSFGNLQYLDFGGGFKVAYREGDAVTDMKDLGEKLSARFRDFCKAYGRELELWFEPGKFLVSESGFLLAQVNVVKNNPNGTLLGLNTGLNHLIRPMMYDAYHDVVNLSKAGRPAEKKYNVVGYMCETDDIAKDRDLPETAEGDILAIRNAGAYGFTMASNYNSRFRPAEVLVYQGKEYLIRERETLEDILKNQVLITF
ncbi:MAG: diaminopimelate decarboxylase [Leadbetterella sp.]|nr:diaminopimelate decarboxylase [Leadbetterella sp.]